MHSWSTISDQDVVAGYLCDASNVRGAADAVVRPADAREVSEVVRHCQAAAVPLTVVGAQTSTTGASVPDGGWVLSTEKLRAISAVEDGKLWAQAGVVLGELQEELARCGWLLPPDPSSRYSCTLGAAIACNASGPRSFLYGPMGAWVHALEVVLPTGDLLEVSRGDPIPSSWPRPCWRPPKVKTAAGYPPPRDLLDLFVGQEGTLGVVTRAQLKLLPLPPGPLGLMLWFSDRPAAVALMRTVRALGRADPRGMVAPRSIEYFDTACLTRLSGHCAIPSGAGAALWCEQELWHGEEAHLEAWTRQITVSGAWADDSWVALDAAALGQLEALRHALPVAVNEEVVRNRMPKVGTDLAVPDDALDEMMTAYEAVGMPAVCFGHLGDNHLHLNLLPRDSRELAQAHVLYEALADRAIALGGTVSAEHGIGKRKRAQLARMVGPEALASMRALKRALDPGWILGRGNVISVVER